MEEDVLILLGVAFNLNLPPSHCLAARPLAGRPGVAAPSGCGFRQSHFFL